MPTFLQPTVPCKRGHFAPLYQFTHSKRCVECVKEDNACNIIKKQRNAAYLRKRYHDTPAVHRAKRREWSITNPERTMLSAAKKTASVKGVPFNLTPRDIVIPDVCPVLGIPLASGKGRGARNDSHLTEVLSEREGIDVSRETVRRLRRGAGQESKRKRRAPKHHKRRERMAQEGAMVLWDGPPHPWFGPGYPAVLFDGRDR